MRWFPFLLLLYLAAAMQKTHLFAVPSAAGDPWPRLEYLVILAVFYALFASETYAPLCGFICGLLADIVGPTTIGTCAIPLGIVAFLIVRIRSSLFREHAFSQIVVGFLAIVLYGLLTAFARWFVGAPRLGFGVMMGTTLGNALYSAMLTPVLFWLMFRLKGILGFNLQGPRGRSLS